MDHIGDRAYLMLEEFRKVFEHMGRLDKPMLAVVAGPALGAGSILASGCDVVLAGASARFGHPGSRGGASTPRPPRCRRRRGGGRRPSGWFLAAGRWPRPQAGRTGWGRGC